MENSTLSPRQRELPCPVNVAIGPKSCSHLNLHMRHRVFESGRLGCPDHPVQFPDTILQSTTDEEEVDDEEDDDEPACEGVESEPVVH
mmetsp:Transcript_32838/g.45829  ORF Transcript_32838/g.45829 Transcript_32838/m.45829 type:complete len:88 (-) Transcript_32838:131-394(-)